MKIIYMRDILKDLWRNKIPVIICIVICIGAGAAAGYKKSDFCNSLSAKDRIKVEKYYEELGKYEKNIKGTEENLKLVNDKIESLQSYIDNSIFMHLNPDRIYTAVVRFSTTFSINESEFVKDRYLSEVLSVAKNGNDYSISIMLPTEERALKAVNAIVERISSEYKISELEFFCHVKTDASIVNRQKECLGNLNSYIKNRIELENSLKKQMSIMDKYKAEKKPAVLSKKDLKPADVIFRYALFGFMAGIIGLISAFTIRRIL